MDSLEAIQLPTSRTFWNSHDPSLDPFDETLVPAMASDPLEECSSTFQQLFPSTGSACDESDDHQAMFKVNSPSHQQTNIFGVHSPNGDGGAEDQSSLATAQSYSCTNAHDHGGSMHHPSASSSQFTWSLPSPPPHYQAGELGGAGGDLDADFFGPLSSNALEAGYGGSENQVVSFLKVPLMRQPSEKLERSTKASWQSAPAHLSLDQSRRSSVFHKDQPLGSPCSVIPGLQGGELPIGSDYNMATTSFAPSSSHAPLHDHDGPFNTPQSMSGTHHQLAGGGDMHHRVTTKRKRSKAPKLSNEVESQRMTHIAVERNRRKQMNEHLAALRALMPGSYVQKGDQASIVGGAIEFVKELEHLLVCLQSQKRRRAYSDLTSPRTPTSRLAMPSPDPAHRNQIVQAAPFPFHSPQGAFGVAGAAAEKVEEVGEARSEAAVVEVRRAAGAEQASVKVMAVRRGGGQLLRAVVALESLALTVVHANITTVHPTVLFSFQALVAPRCRLTAQDIAAALHHSFASLHSSLQF